MTQVRKTQLIRVCLAIVSLCIAWQGCWSSAKVAVASEPTIVKVEEDWELIVAAPDPNSIAPQVTCAISPSGDVDSLHATFELNHQSQPDFVAGGLQLQAWYHETPLTPRKFPRNDILRYSSETVRWTQTMTLVDGTLNFEIVNGSSATWGSFGGQGYLTTDVATTLGDLNGYTPNHSVNNSGVGYAGNRVTSLKLNRVRLITSEGDVLEDATVRIVHQDN